MKKFLLILFISLTGALTAAAQDDNIFDLYHDDIFATLDTTPQPRRFRSEHLIGFKYGYDLCTVQSTPSLSEGYYYSPVNFYFQYTYYHALWDKYNVFGLQAGVKYGRQGYTSELRDWGESNQMIEFPFNAQLKFDLTKHFRFMFNLGTYYGYRLSTDRPGGFDQYDLRHDYGIIGGGGIALIFSPVELHIETNYKYSLCSMYHTNKYSDLYWLLTYPRNIMMSAGLFFKLW